MSQNPRSRGWDDTDDKNYNYTEYGVERAREKCNGSKANGIYPSNHKCHVGISAKHLLPMRGTLCVNCVAARRTKTDTPTARRPLIPHAKTTERNNRKIKKRKPLRCDVSAIRVEITLSVERCANAINCGCHRLVLSAAHCCRRREAAERGEWSKNPPPHGGGNGAPPGG